MQISFLFLLSGFTVWGQAVVLTPSTQITQIDGKSFYVHTVEKGHTLYSISRAYGTDIETIVKHNPGSDKALSTGATLWIPVRKIPDVQAGQDAVSGTGPAFVFHIVKPGETLYSVSRIYGIGVPEIESLNPEAVSEGLKAGSRIRIPVNEKDKKDDQFSPAPYRIHIVKAGETTYGIARDYQVSTDEIDLLNPAARDGLKPGMQLRIPAAQTQTEPIPDGSQKHTVKRRESLSEIAALYGISLQELVAANPSLANTLGNPSKGTVLLIPAKPESEIPTDTLTARTGNALVSKEGWRSEVPCIPDAANRDKKYKVALMLPFFSSGADTIQTEASLARPPADYPSFRFIQFYQGVLQAIDSLEKEGLHLELSVFDVGGDTQQVHRLLQENDFRDYHLFLGPLFSGSFEVMSRYAHKHRIPIVNPMTTRDQVTLDRPGVFKAFPSDADRMHSLSGFLLDLYPGANIFVAGRKGDRDASLRQDFLAALSDEMRIRNLPDSGWIDIQAAGVNPAPFSSRLSASSLNIFVALTADQVLVFNLMRKLYAQQKNYPIIVVGLPAWENFTGLDPDYLQALNLHIVRNTWVDYSDTTTHQFVRDFREKYKAEPDAFAFQAYDLTQFFLRGMLYYGKDFGNCMHRFEYSGLQTVYRFNRKGNHGFSNAYVNIYRIMDFRQVNARKHPVRLE